MSQQPNLSALIWTVANLLRGDLKAHEYGRVILPFTVLRRLDCVLEPTRDQVLAVASAKIITFWSSTSKFMNFQFLRVVEHHK